MRVYGSCVPAIRNRHVQLDRSRGRRGGHAGGFAPRADRSPERERDREGARAVGALRARPHPQRAAHRQGQGDEGRGDRVHAAHGRAAVPPRRAGHGRCPRRKTWRPCSAPSCRRTATPRSSPITCSPRSSPIVCERLGTEDPAQAITFLEDDHGAAFGAAPDEDNEIEYWDHGVRADGAHRRGHPCARGWLVGRDRSRLRALRVPAEDRLDAPARQPRAARARRGPRGGHDRAPPLPRHAGATGRERRGPDRADAALARRGRARQPGHALALRQASARGRRAGHLLRPRRRGHARAHPPRLGRSAPSITPRRSPTCARRRWRSRRWRRPA